MTSSGTSGLRSWPLKTQPSIDYRPVDEQSLEPIEGPPEKPVVHLGYLALLVTTLLAPPIALIVWWTRSFRPNNLQYWQSAPIGGEFEQILAKGIDFVSSAIVAPLVMAFINLLWFNYARILACNEVPNHQRGVRLVSLLELSVTSGGTYNPWKLWNLVRSTRTRLSLIASLVLLSAVSTSLFVNIVAYEAISVSKSFPANGNSTLIRLPSSEEARSLPEKWNAAVQDWSAADSSAVVDVYSALQQLSYRSLEEESGRSWSSESGEYIAVNASKESLDGAQTDVQELWQLPTSRLSITCAKVDMLSMSFVEQGGNFGLVTSSVNFEDREEPAFVAGSYTGSNRQLQPEGRGPNHVILWENNYAAPSTRFVLAVFETRFEQPENSSTFNITTLPAVPSDFGDLPRRSAWWDLVGLQADLSQWNMTVTWYGIACDLQRSSSVGNLTRSKSQIRDWTMSSSSAPEDAHNTLSPMYSFENRLFSFTSPRRSFSGFGNALGDFARVANSSRGTTNMTAYAHAFVYASGAIENILLNSAVSNRSIVAVPEHYNVAGVRFVLKYRMTYVPGILIAGLGSLTLCAGIILGLLVSSWGSLSVRSMRVVDGLRFVVDFVDAVRDDDTLVDASTWKRKELEKWSEGIALRYELATKDTGEHTGSVRLVTGKERSTA